MLRFIRENRYIPILIVIVFAFFLRVYQVNKLPPGLYDDEVSLGYNAYSLLTHGTDEYGVRFPLWFKAFGEYKLPGYIYADIIPIAIFGKNAFAVRFPSIIFGALTPLFLYLFLKNFLSLIPKKTENKFSKIPIISALVLSITPWHIQFSRGAYEAVVAVCLYMVGFWLLSVFYKNKKIRYLIISILFFTASSYTYNLFRILTPLTLLVMFFFLLKNMSFPLKIILFLTLYTILINIPLLLFTLSNQGYARFQQTTAFSQQSLPTSRLSNFPIPGLIAYPFIYLKNFLSYFSPQELFIRGEDNIRFYSSSEFGFLFRWQLPFLIIGLIILLREKFGSLKKIVLWTLFIVPGLAAITISPNALRALLLVIPFSIITAIGIQNFMSNKKQWIKIIFAGILLFGTFETALYFHMYLSHYKNSYTVFWGGAHKEIVEEATGYSEKNYTIVISESLLANEKIYFLFYNDKLRPLFVDTSWQKPKEWGNRRVLYIRGPAAIPSDKNIKFLKTITLDTPLKEPIVQLFEL